MGWALPLSDEQWARASVDTFPRSWQSRLLGRWSREHEREHVSANRRLLRAVRTLADSARGGIRPDASDAEICAQADTTARDYARRLDTLESIVRHGARFAAIRARYGLRIVPMILANFARHLLELRGLLDLWPAVKSRRGALLRLRSARWWRRTFRKLHARTVEACAIDIGLVRRTAGLYVSDDSVRRRGAQNARNAAALQSVSAINEHLQEFTLAELAAKGTANKSIRRVELLTRVAGFELIAKDCGHEAAMVTVSCPSRFHRTTTRQDGRVVDNPKWDGSTPTDAQAYLTKQWARCRAAARRAGLEWYGFRIAEPQQDGTPHWHSILFMPAGRGEAMRALLERYFLLNDNPDEPGARKHRIDVEPIDWKRGSAVGYVIKYVSKNIDGHGVGLDLYGNDAITTSARVEAWAATWRIRQFQQIGGAPVGVWREIRRVHPSQLERDDAPDALRDALTAVNVAKTEPGIAAIAWKRYTILQGGTSCKRAALRVRLVKERTGEIGRYGEPMAARPVGVWAEGVEYFAMSQWDVATGARRQRKASWEVASERCEWAIAHGIDSARRAARRLFPRSGEAASTRIHVNNCTCGVCDACDPTFARHSQFSPVRRTFAKLGRFARPNAPPGGLPGTSAALEHAP